MKDRELAPERVEPWPEKTPAATPLAGPSKREPIIIELWLERETLDLLHDAQQLLGEDDVGKVLKFALECLIEGSDTQDADST
jgi:hypothetical protein